MKGSLRFDKGLAFGLSGHREFRFGLGFRVLAFVVFWLL